MIYLFGFYSHPFECDFTQIRNPAFPVRFRFYTLSTAHPPRTHLARARVRISADSATLTIPPPLRQKVQKCQPLWRISRSAPHSCSAAHVRAECINPPPLNGRGPAHAGAVTHRYPTSLCALRKMPIQRIDDGGGGGGAGIRIVLTKENPA